MRGLRIAACGTALVTVGLSILIGLALGGVVPATTRPGDGLVAPFFALAVLVPTAVGLLIAIRRPDNVIAWIMLIGPLTVLGAAADVISSGWTLQLSRAMWPFLYAWPIAVAFVFPNGHLLSPRWRWVVGVAAASFVGFIAVSIIDPTPFRPPGEAIRNPLLHNRVGELILGTGILIPLWLGILGSLFAGAVAIRLRVRRSTGIERLQALWLAWAAALIPIGLLMCAAGWLVFGDHVGTLVVPFLILTQVAVALAVWIAVVRYRLYAIERLINRTLVYAAISVVLAIAYAGITLALGVLVGAGSDWVVAVATLSVAVAFRPLRSRVQGIVDRRFSRARYEAVHRVHDFEDEVREGRRAPEEIGAVLAEALGDPRAEVLFWLPETEAYAGPTGEIAGTLAVDSRARTEIDRGDTRLAVLLHDPALLDSQDLLYGVLAAATLSIEMACVRVELRLQLAEVEASRTRIVEAGYEERRRLERDLHDGAQQRLVSLGVQVRRMQRTLPTGASILSPALDQVVNEISAAIADLRQIAAGVRPARLDDGLSAALLDLAGSAPIPVDVDVPGERVAASVETAAYFVACEALTNAVKYAFASRIGMRAVRENGSLLVTVTDDGVGGAVLRRGSGLAGLQDRVAAHGGSLEIISKRGEGTRIEVSIPCES